MSEVWFVSDTHFGHKNIIDYENRPFKDVEEMNEKLIENWNNTVNPNDVVYHLGDFSFGKNSLRDSIIPRLNGYKILRKGNHDYRTSNTKWKDIGFKEVYDDDIMYVDGDKSYCLSHYPLDEEVSLKLINNGIVHGNVCGHVHSNIDKLDPARYLCVSVENTGYAPIHLDIVRKHFNK